MKQSCAISSRLALLLYAAFAAATAARLEPALAISALAALTLSAVAPVPAALALAALLPLGSTVGALLATNVPVSDALVLVFTGGVALNHAIRRHVPPAVPVTVPLFALAIVLSFMVPLSGVYVHSATAVRDQLWLLVTGRYFDAAFDLGHRQAAAVLFGLALLASVAAVVRDAPAARSSVVRMLVAGAAGAALLNLARLVGAAIATGDAVGGLQALLRDVRVDAHFGDVNAAGSYFALALFCALGSVAVRDRATRATAAVAATSIALALWITGSRAAILAVLVTAALAIATHSWRNRLSRKVLVAGAGTLATATALAIWLLPNQVFGPGTSVAIEVRRDMAIASFRLVREAPVFGIGIGQFFAASPDAMRGLPVAAYYTRENAHNNYLQVLAELGLVGFLLFVLVIAGLLRAGWGEVRSGRAPAEQAGAFFGVVAFLLSAMLGHPLLIAAVGYVFWLGVALAGGGITPLRPGRRRAGRHIAVIAALALLVSLPVRAWDYERRMDLEHMGQGLSPWQLDGPVRYRYGSGAATLYVPADAAAVEIPLYLDSPDPATVNVIIESTLMNRLVLAGRQWTSYRLIVRDSGRRRFVPVRLQFESPVSFRVGKVVPVEPSR